MPLFSEGKHNATVKEIKCIEHRFKQEHEKAYEVKVEVAGQEDGEERHATIYMPLTADYSMRDAMKTEAQVTCEDLAKLGVPHDGKDFSKLDTLVGQEVEIFGKTNNKGYLNFYINTGKPEKEVDPNQVANELQSLWGTGEAQTATSQTEFIDEGGKQKDGDDIPF